MAPAERPVSRRKTRMLRKPREKSANRREKMPVARVAPTSTGLFPILSASMPLAMTVRTYPSWKTARMSPISDVVRPNSWHIGDDTAEKPYQGMYPKKIDTTMTTSSRSSDFISKASF